MSQMMDPEVPKTWNTDDLDFDEEGRLIIKDTSLIYYFEKYLMLVENPVPKGDSDGLMVPKCGGGETPIINPDCIDVPFGGSEKTRQSEKADHIMFIRKRGKKEA